MNLLSQLRDIHYPNAISFWPLPPGWYFLLALLLLMSLAGLFFYYRYRKKTALRRMILKKINFLRDHELQSSAHLFEELSVLLKRAALHAFPRHEVACLYGENWLKFLDRTSDNTSAFTTGAGKILATAPYQLNYEVQREEFFVLIEAWVKKNL